MRGASNAKYDSRSRARGDAASVGSAALTRQARRTPDPHAWGDAVHLRNRAGEGGGVDDVLARCQLPPITADDVRRETRPLPSTRTSGGGIRAGSHAVNPTPQDVVRWPPPPIAETARRARCSRSSARPVLVDRGRLPRVPGRCARSPSGRRHGATVSAARDRPVLPGRGLAAARRPAGTRVRASPGRSPRARREPAPAAPPSCAATARRAG